ncbi:Na+/melibiose symporter [Salinihabitans flavidus]|uniref:Na+/melibiose symporter n=1 Tax=Salinihabitans flavidus TaxID=569882 RepID=A0A1H8MPK2_9RHOB|nr:MFS transporter [Salinihabitans flavidus]SEO19239.1 Na+/melibiose symporter [Salinihabitans flavidus]
MGWRIFLFAAVLSAAGIPLYIHLPLFAHRELGLGFEVIGLTLLALRAVDFVQDPLLGRLVDAAPDHQPHLAALALGTMALGFALLFGLPVLAAPPLPPLVWMIATLIVIFTGFSLGMILFYAQGVTWAEDMGGHFGVAAWREAGLLAGILLATLAPAAISALWGPQVQYGGYGLLLAAICLVALPVVRPIWQRGRPGALRPALGAPARRLLGLALINALPLGLTSTLFLLFVEYRLDMPDMAGLFLLVFFAAAGLSAPLWARLGERFGPRRVLFGSMTLAIVSFAWVATLGPGDGAAFALISAASGLALGADFVILPALFAGLMGRGGAGAGFGLWSLAQKLSLALAAGSLVFLGLGTGTTTGAGAPAPAALTWGYAVLPCLLKLVALAMIVRLPHPAKAPA